MGAFLRPAWRRRKKPLVQSLVDDLDSASLRKVVLQGDAPHARIDTLLTSVVVFLDGITVHIELRSEEGGREVVFNPQN